MGNKEYSTSKQRSENMSRIKSKNTRPEILLRKALWKRNLRGYRIHYEKVAGTPDIAFTKYKIAIFIDGDFWHGYNWEDKKEKIKSNRQYWIPKIEKNIVKDEEVNYKLLYTDWTVVRFWEHEVLKNIDYCISTIVEEINASKFSSLL